MKKLFVVLTLALLFVSYMDEFAYARAGRGGSFGSRGSRTYSAPQRQTSTPTTPQRQVNQQQNPQYNQPMAPQGGGFMRSLAGGLVGGLIGGLLFSSLGHAAGFGSAGAGIGLLDILLIGFGIFMLVRFFRRKKPEASYSYQSSGDSAYQAPAQSYEPQAEPVTASVRRFDPSFDEKAFREEATDIFFKVQSAWKGRDMKTVESLLAPEILKVMRGQADEMKRDGRVNRLENIAVKDIFITEAWQEEGVEYITLKIDASVLDYVTDESGGVIEGSSTDPVKFSEYWTFVRSIGSGRWRLSAIQQDAI